ncbi:hypothetical protein QN277_005287 [Acacia crassicarpa]|uniref:Gnk2-homologous domain-containing protein n=1 Tax=Acacia crassicarpa TaxID=499986 RepID=A0AAE1JWJ9_9FABA|nr:hypothetical protein QN277_005287 [Acacia crassicarpa]
MPNSKSSVLVFLFSHFFFFFFVLREAAPIYSSHVCTDSIKYQPNSTFQFNLNLLLSSLTSNAAKGSHFFRTQLSNAINGLFLCRGDTLTTTCSDCVSAASREIERRCPVQKEAIIWYDLCMLRYSNQSLNNFVPSSEISNTETVDPKNKERFNEILAGLLNSLAAKAVISHVDKFETEEVNFTRTEKLFGLVQCTPDLTAFGCNSCLKSAIASVPICCDGKLGATVLLPACNIRYELFPFFNTTPSSNPPAIRSPPSGRSNFSVILGFVIPIVGVVSLFAFGFCSFTGKQGRDMLLSWRKKNLPEV